MDNKLAGLSRKLEPGRNNEQEFEATIAAGNWMAATHFPGSRAQLGASEFRVAVLFGRKIRTRSFIS
ncbi:hypothetical protein QO004_005926 [Rhizobium mesoamericanum]|nr:hypothetical protein [Rhizobium mesoamericanum]